VNRYLDSEIVSADENWNPVPFPPPLPEPSAYKTWFTERIKPSFALGVNLKPDIGNTSMRRILSELSALYQVGYVDLEFPNSEADKRRAIAGLEKIYAYYKFYVRRRADHGDGCPSVISIPTRLVFLPASRGKMIIELHSMYSDLDIEGCERFPF
jgi:hypothetical protein